MTIGAPRHLQQISAVDPEPKKNIFVRIAFGFLIRLDAGSLWEFILDMCPCLLHPMLEHVVFVVVVFFFFHRLCDPQS